MHRERNEISSNKLNEEVFVKLIQGHFGPAERTRNLSRESLSNDLFEYLF